MCIRDRADIVGRGIPAEKVTVIPNAVDVASFQLASPPDPESVSYTHLDVYKRQPLMDHVLVEWLASLPSNLKVQGQDGKWLLKKAFEPSLSQDILLSLIHI